MTKEAFLNKLEEVIEVEQFTEKSPAELNSMQILWELNLSEFRKRMLQFVSKYIVPTQYERLGEMPLSANGKIDRLQLQKRINEKNP